MDESPAVSPEEAELIGCIKNALLKAGALRAGMSGSGSAVFGLFEGAAAQAAAAERMKQQHPDCFVEACESLRGKEERFSAIIAAGGSG